MVDKVELIEEEQDLYEHYRFVVDKGQSLLRIDKYLFSRIQNVSRNKVQSAANAGCILVNDKSVKSNYKVKPSDVISIVMAQPPREIELVAENIPLEIIFEDDDIVIVNKKAGMVVHPAYGNYNGTLVNALMYHFSQQRKKDSDLRPMLVHRIDKDTSGVMVVTKNEIAQTKLANEFFKHTIDRVYIALVWGDFKSNEGTIVGNIGRNPSNRKVMTVFSDEDHGKKAITHYKVIKRYGYVSIVECRLETGRTHQIRAHFKHIGHPLFNDESYGGNRILKGTPYTKYKQFINNCFKILPRQALHAKSLGFLHPKTGKQVFFDSELPEDMKAVIEKWERFVATKEMD